MKKLALTLCLLAAATAAFAQGTVKFANTSTTLVTVDGAGIPGTPGTYYFGLFTAAVGTTDPLQFSFTGVYGTNTAAVGRFQGGPNTGIAVPGWATGVERAFIVAGWSANMGHDFQTAWAQPGFLAPATGWYFGWSAIGRGSPGGTDALGNPVPALVSFGAAPGITTGFGLPMLPVPEPTSMALAGLGAAALLIFRRRK